MRLLCALALCAVCVTSCDEHSELARVVATETQVRYFGLALDNFAQDCGRYPSSAEGLNALIKRPSDISEAPWRSPYLDCETIPTDPWGHNYVYTFPGTHFTNRFDIYSYGADGLSRTSGNDADDINNWKTQTRRQP